MQVTLDTLKHHRFPPHGGMSVNWEGRLMHVQLRGPFNREMVHEGVALLDRMGRSAWPADGRLVELTQWHSSMLMPPDAVEDFRRAVDHFAEQGFNAQHTLIVAAPDVEGRWLMLPKLEPMWRRWRPLEVFDNLPDAMARAQALLQALPPLPPRPVRPPG